MCLNPINIVNKQHSKYVGLLRSQGYNESEIFDFTENIPYRIVVPCGKCFECLQAASNDWAYRCSLEAEKYKDNCFVTLTYANTDGVLHKRDLQLFLKRLRKFLNPLKIRYFGCGEYGSKGRPHFHLCIFNWKPNDLVFWKIGKANNKVYLSKTLSDIWKNGYITVSDFTIETARYSSLYMQKMLFIKDFADRIKIAPFRVMSRRPGIGGDCLDRLCIDTDKIYLNGHYIKISRYFLYRLKLRGIDITPIVELRGTKQILLKKYPEAFGKSLKVRKMNAEKFFKKFSKRY